MKDLTIITRKYTTSDPPGWSEVCNVTQIDSPFKVVHKWILCGTRFNSATKMCPAHVYCTGRHLNSG